MAIKLISNYSKRLGLPGFSSHQFCVSVETELVTTDDIPGECQRLYRLLQSNVDEQIQVTGFVPPFDYGMDPATPAVPPNGTNRHAHANGNPPPNGINGHARHAAPPVQSANTPNWQRGPAWKCSDKQRDLILKLVDEHQLDKNDVEALSIERFGKGVRILNKVEASGLIEELLETHGGGSQRQPTNKRGNGTAYAGANGRSAA